MGPFRLELALVVFLEPQVISIRPVGLRFPYHGGLCGHGGIRFSFRAVIDAWR